MTETHHVSIKVPSEDVGRLSITIQHNHDLNKVNIRKGVVHVGLLHYRNSANTALCCCCFFFDAGEGGEDDVTGVSVTL